MRRVSRSKVELSVTRHREGLLDAACVDQHLARGSGLIQATAVGSSTVDWVGTLPCPITARRVVANPKLLRAPSYHATTHFGRSFPNNLTEVASLGPPVVLGLVVQFDLIAPRVHDFTGCRRFAGAPKEVFPKLVGGSVAHLHAGLQVVCPILRD